MKIEKIATVISNKMDKTVVVEAVQLYRHPLYKKVLKRRTKFYAHDEGNKCQVGDVVRIVQTRPLSKLKRWRVEEIVKRAEVVESADTLASGVSGS